MFETDFRTVRGDVRIPGNSITENSPEYSQDREYSNFFSMTFVMFRYLIKLLVANDLKDKHNTAGTPSCVIGEM